MGITHSYTKLLVSETAYPSDIDAIVTPAGRSGSHLTSLATLSGETGVPLIILSSKGATPDSVCRQLANTSTVWGGIDIPDGYTHPLLDLPADSCVPDFARAKSDSDLSLKRNVGLLLGRTIGNKIFFADDDMTFTRQQLGYVGQLLSTYAIAGFRSRYFPDRGLVDHLEREKNRGTEREDANEHESVFISGNGLGVNLGLVHDYFPKIYNEDWLYAFNSVRNRMAAYAGEAWQDPYRPFDRDAASQEFGETIANGLYYALYKGKTERLVRVKYWEDVLTHRRRKIENLRDGRRWPRNNENLQGALKVNELLTPDVCAEYVARWRTGQLACKALYNQLSAFKSPLALLRELDLAAYSSHDRLGLA